MNKKNVCFIVPTYNEEKTISNVVDKLNHYGKVIVVNDCSTDKTLLVLKKKKIILLKHKKNLGYEAALNSGFKRALKLNMMYAITIDADNQHKILDAKKVLNFLLKDYAVVSGVRNKLPRIMEKIFSFYTNFFFNISDPLCGLKGYNTKICKNFGLIDLNNKIGTSIILNCKRNNLRIKQFTINQRKRLDKSRYGGSIKANLKILITLFVCIKEDFFRFFKL